MKIAEEIKELKKDFEMIINQIQNEPEEIAVEQLVYITNMKIEQAKKATMKKCLLKEYRFLILLNCSQNNCEICINRIQNRLEEINKELKEFGE
jgi:hypothetical protein